MYAIITIFLEYVYTQISNAIFIKKYVYIYRNCLKKSQFDKKQGQNLYH